MCDIVNDAAQHFMRQGERWRDEAMALADRHLSLEADGSPWAKQERDQIRQQVEALADRSARELDRAVRLQRDGLLVLSSADTGDYEWMKDNREWIGRTKEIATLKVDDQLGHGIDPFADLDDAGDDDDDLDDDDDDDLD